MIHLITYADNKFKNSALRLYDEAKNTNWFNTIEIYNPEKLTPEFKYKYHDILSMKRGGGYWIWKYDIISQKLKQINENDILIYLDAGCIINKHGRQRFDEYIDILYNNDNGILSFQTEHLEKKYTTKEIFNFFNVSDNEQIYNSGQLVGGILIMKKNKSLIQQIERFNDIIENDKLLITDHYNNTQHVYFIDNRHDQSILSIIRKMYNPILLKDETYFIKFGSKNSLTYPFWATRKK